MFPLLRRAQFLRSARHSQACLDSYRHRIDRLNHEFTSAAKGRQASRIDRELRLGALKAERDAILTLRRGELGTEATRKLIRELDTLEARYVG